VRQPLVGQNLLILEASLSQSDTPQWCSTSTAPFNHLWKSLVVELFSSFPSWAPMKRHTPPTFLHIFQGPQQGSPPSRFSSQSTLRERRSTSRAPFNQLWKSLVIEPPPGSSAGPLWKKIPLLHSYTSFRARNKGTLPPGFLHRAPL
jgi:hypothetical protein